MPLEHWQACGIKHSSRKPILVYDNPHSKYIICNIQSEPPPLHFWAIPVPHIVYKGDKTGMSLPTSSPQEVAESNEGNYQFPFLQTRESKHPQSLLRGAWNVWKMGSPWKFPDRFTNGWTSWEGLNSHITVAVFCPLLTQHEVTGVTSSAST